MRTLTTTLVALGACFSALWPSSAAAQDPTPRVTVAAGGGISTPFHADFDFTAREWDVSVRAAISRRVAVEVFYEHWEHTTRDVSLDQAIQGPSGFLGRVARIEQATTYRKRTAGFNALVTAGSPRVSLSGGGGIGLLAYDRRDASTYSGCDAGTAALCRSIENTFSSDGFTGQGVAEVDVAVTRRVQLYGRYLLVLPLTDPGFGHGSLGAGVRITLW